MEPIGVCIFEILGGHGLLLRLQIHHHHTQAAATTTLQTSLAMDPEEKKQVQSIRDQLKGHSLPDGGEIVGSINSSSSEFNATNNRAHIVRQFESGSTASDRKTTRETPDRKGITFSLFSLEYLRQYFVRKLIIAVSVCILLAIYIFCSKVSLHLRVRSSTQPSASQQVEIVKRILLSLSDDSHLRYVPAPLVRAPYYLPYEGYGAGARYGAPYEGYGAGAIYGGAGARYGAPYEGYGASAGPYVEITPYEGYGAPPYPYVPAPYPYEEIRIPPVPAPCRSEKIRIPPVPAPPPKAPEKPKLLPRRGQTKGNIAVDLQQYFGHKRKDVAELLGVSVSTFKRMCRQQGIPHWQNQMGISGSVSKPLDQDGERNTSTACETPSHNVQTGTEGELFGQNEVANVLQRDFRGGLNALDTESGLIMVSRPPDQHGERNTSTACEIPSHNVEKEMGCQNSKPNEFQPDSFEDLNLEEFLCDCDFLPLGEEPSLEGLVSGSDLDEFQCDCDFLPLGEEPSLEGLVSGCSDPATCQHPMPTNPDTMTTTHKMPCLAAEGDMRFVTLKLTYRKKIIKFQFPLMSGIIELKEEVKKRLKLELDSFDIEYKDGDEECIFLGCDEDLRNHLHLQLLSNEVIRLLVVDSDANTTNFR